MKSSANVSTERPRASSEEARHRMQATPQRDTPPELRLRKAFYRLGLRYRTNVKPLGTSPRRADIVFRQSRVAVFVDGCFWHGCPVHGTWPKANAAFWRNKIETNRQRDRDTYANLKRAGWISIRVWEHDIPDRMGNRIARVVAARSKLLIGRKPSKHKAKRNVRQLPNAR